MHFMVFTKSLTTEVMCRFVDQLASHFDHKIHLRIDGRCSPRWRRTALPAALLARAAPRQAGQRRPQAQPARTSPKPGSRLAAETRRSCYAYKSFMPPFRYHALSARAWSRAVSKLLGSYAA